MTDIDEAFLAERERIRAAASPLPWAKATKPWCGYAELPAADADFIVDAVNSQPALIAEIRRLLAVVSVLERDVRCERAQSDLLLADLRRVEAKGP